MKINNKFSLSSSVLRNDPITYVYKVCFKHISNFNYNTRSFIAKNTHNDVFSLVLSIELGLKECCK